MGVTVRQKVKGKGKPWWVFINHNGQRTSRKIGDKKAAQTVASKIEAKLALGEFGFDDNEEKDPTFGEYAVSWIKTTVPATCKESTVRGYQDILRIHVLPVFENLKVLKTKRSKIKEFLLGKINQGYSVSTVSHMKDVISGVLNEAVEDEVIQANPAHRLGKIFKNRGQQERIDPLDTDELKTLLDTVQIYSPKHYALFLLLARTGMRIGEALAMQWEDVDFVGRFIEVKRSIVRGKISTPKNGKSRRVDMSLQLAETLKNHAMLSRYVFANGNGGMIDKDNWRRRVFYNTLVKAELRRIRIHDLRGTPSPH